MLSMKRVLLISFCLCQLYVIDASIDIFEKSVETDEELWYFDGAAPSLTYALCNLNDENDSRRCQVIRDRSTRSNEIDVCEVTLKRNQSNKPWPTAYDEAGVVPLGNDNVLLYLSEVSTNPYVKFVTLNLRDCKLGGDNEISVFNPIAPLPTNAVRIAAFDDRYEVHYLKEDGDSDDLIHARMVIDVEGKIISGPSEVDTITRHPLWRASLPDVFAIAMDSRDKGVVYLKARNDTIAPHMVILRPDGTKRHLELAHGYNRSLKYVNNSRHSGFSVSTVHNVISICSNLKFGNENFKCLQYDEDGNMNFETDFVGDGKTKYISTATYNLPNGGILVSALYLCETCDAKKIENIGLSVFKIDATGRTVGKIILKNFKYQDVTSRPNFFYVNEKEEYCITTTYWKGRLHNLKLITNCFVDADFVIQ